MQKRKDNLNQSNMSNNDEKREETCTKYTNISYDIKKLFSYSESDIIRIEQNLIIYNSIIESINNNGNKIIKKEIEKIIRNKDDKNYVLKNISNDIYEIYDFKLKKVELDFKFIECSLCFELIKFICILNCNHTFCFLCFNRLLNMTKKDDQNLNEPNNRNQTNNRNQANNRNDTNNRNDINYNDRYSNNIYDTGKRNNWHRFSLSYVDYIENSDTFYKKYNKDKNNVENKLECPFCKEQNEYIFVGLNNFYTFFNYNNLLEALLSNDNINDKNEINENKEDKKINESNNKNYNSINSNKQIENHYNIDEYLNHDNLKKKFSSFYDDTFVLKNILKEKKEKDEKENDEKENNTVKKSKSNSNSYLFYYYEKYIKWKKKRIKYILEYINTKKKYAFFCKLFLDIRKNVIYEYFYIFSISMLLTSYVCLLSPCRDYWTNIQKKKIDKYITNKKIDKYFDELYIQNKKTIEIKMDNSVTLKYYEAFKKNEKITNVENCEKANEYYKIIDIFSKCCFSNLDNINFLVYLKYYSYTKLSDLNNHLNEHKKVYCEICIGNNDNIFLFEYNIFYKRHLKDHIEYGEKNTSNKYYIRHIYCYICEYYLYDYELYKDHINKYHFSCKFCFNKPFPKEANTEKVDEEVVHYNQLQNHVYRDYSSLFEHYKKCHNPCLYEQCIFVVFDNKIDLCMHLAKNHNDRDKKKGISISLGGLSYNDVRNRERLFDKENDENEMENEECNVETHLTNKEKLDIKNYKCIYNFSKFSDIWYFDYFVEGKIIDFLNYFEMRNKKYFIYIIKTDMDLILKIMEYFSNNKTDIYISVNNIYEINKSIMKTDFYSNKKNNFFTFQMFSDYINEKISYLLYNKEDLEKNVLYLFFNIIVKKSFILYYSFFFIFLTQKGLDLENEKSSNTETTKCSNYNVLKNKAAYKYTDEILEMKKLIENYTNIKLDNISKYGLLYLIFLFYNIDKYSFTNLFTYLKNISLYVNKIHHNLYIKEKQEDNNSIMIEIHKKKNTNCKQNNINNESLTNIFKESALSELENIDELIKKYKKNNTNNIINNIYNKNLEITNKIILDLLYYIYSDLNLTCFFYTFLNNYFCIQNKNNNVNIINNISQENKNRINKRISKDTDIFSLNTISKDLFNMINAHTIEECLSTVAEYYRIRKDINNILMNNKNIYKTDKKNTVDNNITNTNLYDISLSLRIRYSNIIESTKENELYYIYYYIHSLINLTPNENNKVEKDEFPKLNTNSENANMDNSYKNILQMNKNSNLNKNEKTNKDEFPPLMYDSKKITEKQNKISQKKEKNLKTLNIQKNNVKKNNEMDLNNYKNKDDNFKKNKNNIPEDIIDKLFKYPEINENNKKLNASPKKKNKKKNVQNDTDENLSLNRNIFEMSNKKNMNIKDNLEKINSNEFPSLPFNVENNIKQKNPKNKNNIKKNNKDLFNKNDNSYNEMNFQDYIMNPNDIQFNNAKTIRRWKKCKNCTYHNSFNRTNCELCYASLN